MSSDADDGIHLRVKRFRAPQGMHRNAVLLDLVDGPFEVLFTDKSQKSNEVVRPPEYTRRQNAVQFGPLGLQLADCRLQMVIPLRIVPSTYHPMFCKEHNPVFSASRRTKQPKFHYAR